MDPIILGKKISKLRKEHKMTQATLAERLHISDKTISKWECGSSVPDIVMIKKISEIFDVPVESLIDGSKLDKRKASFHKYFLLLLKFIGTNIIKILFVITFILLLIYFINNYNSITVYNINSDDTNIYTKGSYFIESKEKNILIIDNIQIHNVDYEMVTIKTKLYTVVNGDKVYLGESDNLDGIVVEDIRVYNGIDNKDVIREIKNNLYLTVDILDAKGKNYNYEVKFNVIKNFSNNKLIYLNKKNGLENKETSNFDKILTEVILLNNGFIKDEETNTYIKEDKIKIIVDLESASMTILKEDKAETSIYILYYDNKLIKVKKFDKNSSTINNYQYYYEKDDLICMQGKCSTYKKDTKYVLNVLESIK